MFIKQIEQFNGYEADLVVSDGNHNVRCYFSCYPPLKNSKKARWLKRYQHFWLKI